MAYLSMLLQQDVNKLYPDILNHDITPPPQWPGRVSHSFFLKRRPWFNTQIDFWWDKVIDYLQFNWSEYWLVKDWVNIKVYKWATLLATQTYSSTVNHKLLTVWWPSWTLLDSWTWATSNVTLWVYTITDSTKTWTVNAYALKWIYIYDATVWTWQVLQIVSNTATVLTLYSWWIIQPTWISYKIFDTYSEVVAFVWADWIYAVHNTTDVTKIKRFWTAKDCVYNLWRLFVVDSNDNVLVSETWTNCYYYSQPVWTYSWVLGMISFQDFVLMMCSDKIWMIKKESITIDSNSNPIDTFKTLTVTNVLGSFWKKSFTVYNQWLYVFTWTKKLMAVTITPSGTDRFTVQQDDQWIYIQQYLDSILAWDNVEIAINAEKVCMVHKWTWDTAIYMYDIYYKFRYRWSTLLPIHWVVVFNNLYYLWDQVYKTDTSLTQDVWANDYTPRIRSILWEEDIFSLKTYMMHKLYIWQNTSSETTIKYVCHLDWTRYEVKTDFKNIKYLTDSTLFNQNWTFWTNIYGYWIFGWNWFSVSDYIMWYVNCVEFPITLTSSLTEIYIEWDIEFGGMMMQYDVYDSYITPINSVAWFTI